MSSKDFVEKDYYKVLGVPVAPLPENAFTLTNTMPANPTGSNTPTYAALDGALRAATAYQDEHPTHKVSVLLATDGDPILEHCRACARALVAALEDIKFTRPEEIQGLL